MQTETVIPKKAPRRNDVLVEDAKDLVAYTFHEDMTAAPKDWIFVFGSNLAGFHGAGAALAAYKYYGAELGVGWGLTGQSFAIPTKDEHIETLPLEAVKGYIDGFVAYTKAHPDKNFFVTRVGCGLAGFTDDQIAPLFREAINCSFANEWMEYII